MLVWIIYLVMYSIVAVGVGTYTDEVQYMMPGIRDEIVICPKNSTDSIRNYLGEDILKNQSSLFEFLLKNDIKYEHDTLKAQSPFCDKSLVSSSVVQAFFPLDEIGIVKPLFKFFFSSEGDLIAIEDLTQRRAPW
ncbi:hypothetical protein L1787_13385 [Acuticoccus sp. M5D2P5]|uniref:hypothetical protein n=1 Tax=Acuticoccus kalidii TaxID=2910977 RepID=UPI001F3EF2AF|nr:hypothetical protein [Acuticoccus kalidii]MCF3934397.1 hypothetical protein [Acuticoccus kalidii]